MAFARRFISRTFRNQHLSPSLQAVGRDQIHLHRHMHEPAREVWVAMAGQVSLASIRRARGTSNVLGARARYLLDGDRTTMTVVDVELEDEWR